MNGDPTAMAAYALGLTPLLDHLQSIKRSVKHAPVGNNLTGTGKVRQNQNMLGRLNE